MGEDILSTVADELDVIASWHTGPRRNRVAQLAERVRAASAGQSDAPQYSDSELAELAALEAEGDKTSGT